MGGNPSTLSLEGGEREFYRNEIMRQEKKLQRADEVINQLSGGGKARTRKPKRQSTVTFKKGALHRQLGYTGHESLNAVMRRIKKSDIGTTVFLPAPINKPKKITRLLKERAVFGLNLQGLR